MRRLLLLAAVVAFALPCAAHAEDVSWLCRPGADPNPCAGDQTTRYYEPDGSSHVATPAVPKDPAIDCFYVYPTVSNQPTPNATATPDPRSARSRSTRRSA